MLKIDFGEHGVALLKVVYERHGKESVQDKIKLMESLIPGYECNFDTGDNEDDLLHALETTFLMPILE